MSKFIDLTGNKYFHKHYGRHNNNFIQFAEFYKESTNTDYVNKVALKYQSSINNYE